MKIAFKLFLSYVVLILVGAFVISIFASLTAPVSFANNIQDMQSHMQSQGMHMGNMNGNTMGNAEIFSDEVVDELNQNFRDTLYQTLWGSSLIAILLASGISFYISQRITQPIRQLVRASQHIAEGYYEHSIELKTSDEIGDLVQSFNQMAQALAETETMRQQLIADVSHELKTPLASIKGYMEGLQDGVIPATNETYQQIHHEATRLQRLVQDLQELSRVEAGQMPLEVQRCNLHEIAQATVDWLKPQYDEKSIALTIHKPKQAIWVNADYDRLRQVFMNLLGNALQYTPENGRVTVTLDIQSSFAHITVQDTGVGLSEQDLKHIFDRFDRVDKSRARASGGSGIGLTIARHIIVNLGGKLWVESAGLGQGSSFHIQLPLA